MPYHKSELITNTEAEALVEAAGKRSRAAVDALANFRECLDDPHDFDAAIAELRGATADAYDAGIDYVLSERGNPTSGRFAIEIDAAATQEDIDIVLQSLRDGDFAYQTGGPIRSVTTADGARHVAVDSTKPDTPYGVRVFYDDDTMEEIQNVIGVQVANLADGSFPVGFMRVEHEHVEYLDAKAEGRTLNMEPVPGYWDAEGIFKPFEIPKTRPGW